MPDIDKVPALVTEYLALVRGNFSPCVGTSTQDIVGWLIPVAAQENIAVWPAIMIVSDGLTVNVGKTTKTNS